MKRTLLYALFTLVAITIMVFLYLTRNSGTLEDDDFAVEDISGVKKIFMADKEGMTLLLSRTDDGNWIVNEQFAARKEEMELLLNTLKNIKVKRTIPEEARSIVIANMAVQHVKVEIWSSGKKPVKVYYVGTEAPGGEGNYMWMEGADNLYVVEYPGFRGHLTSRYVTDENAWRLREIFGTPMEEIAGVSVIYNGVPNKVSFEVGVVTRDSFSVKDYPATVDPLKFSGNSTPAERRVDEKNVITWLSAFESVHGEAYANDHPSRDSVLASAPFCKIVLIEKDGDKAAADIFFKPVTKRTKTQFDTEGNPVPFDADRYFALVKRKGLDGKERSDFMIVQHFVFGKLFADVDQFRLKKE